MTDNIFKLGELFCGPGGLALGAGLASGQSKNGYTFSISHEWGVDKDPAAIETYKHNIASRYGGKGYCEDANDFCKNILNTCAPIDALAFGFPCNDFSLVGKQKGTKGNYGKLYKAGIRVINALNPSWFIAENVSGIHSANDGKTFKKILRELSKAGQYGGYNLTVNLYKFEEYGIPQCRHRYIIVGIRQDKELSFKVPKKTHGERNGLLPFMTAREALEGINADAFNSISTRHNHRVIERLKLTPPWQNAWFLDELLKMKPAQRRDILKKLPWYKKEFKKQTDRQILKRIKDARLLCKKARMSHIYRRLDANKPSYTITGSGGGGTHVYHWHDPRALTNRERARLQSFPDWFNLQGSKEEIRKQIGMAVPPMGARLIFESILKTFAGIDYDDQPASYIGGYLE